MNDNQPVQIWPNIFEDCCPPRVRCPIAMEHYPNCIPFVGCKQIAQAGEKPIVLGTRHHPHRCHVGPCNYAVVWSSPNFLDPHCKPLGKKVNFLPRLGDIEVSPQFKQKHKTGVNMNAKFRGCPGECHAPIPTVTAARCSLPRLLVLQKSSCSSWCSHWQGPKLCGASPVICRQSTKPFFLSHTLRAYLDAPNKYNTVPA